MLLSPIHRYADTPTREKKMKNNPNGENRYLSLKHFVTPIFFSLLLPLLTSCQAPPGKAEGSLTLLYTSEVGGRLDPCG